MLGDGESFLWVAAAADEGASQWVELLQHVARRLPRLERHGLLGQLRAEVPHRGELHAEMADLLVGFVRPLEVASGELALGVRERLSDGEHETVLRLLVLSLDRLILERRILRRVSDGALERVCDRAAKVAHQVAAWGE